MKQVFLLIISLLFCSLAIAQVKDTVALKQVDIAADKQELTEKSLISMELLESTPLASVAEMLSRASSIYVKNYGPGSLSTISLRGASASQTLVEWKGIALNNPLSGQIDLSLIPSFLVDNYQLSSNAQSGAIGGTVVLDQQAARLKSNRVIIGGGSFGKQFAGGEIHSVEGRHHLSARLYHQRSNNNFTFQNNALVNKPQQEQRNASFEQLGGQFEFGLPLGAYQLKTGIWIQDYKRNLPSIMSYEGAGRDEQQLDKDFRGYLSLDRYGRKSKLHQQLNLSVLNNEYLLKQRLSSGWATILNSRSRVQQYQYILGYEFNGENLDYALEISPQVQEASISDFTQFTQRTPSRTMLLGKAHLNYSLSSSTGLGVSAEQGWYSDVSAPLNAQIYLKKVLGNYSQQLSLQRNVRVPTLNDLHWYPGGNSALKPERAIGLLWSQSFRLNDHELRAETYYREVKDWIQWRPSDFAYWKPFNLAEVRSYGVEFNYSWEGSKYKLKPKFLSSLAYNRAYQMGLDHQTQLMYMPRMIVNSWIFVQWLRVDMGLGLQHVGLRETQTRATPGSFHELPGFTLLHAQIKMDMLKERLQVSSHFNNLLNTRYQNVIWRAMPGFNWEIQVQWKF